MYKVDNKEFTTLRQAKEYGYNRNFSDIQKVIRGVVKCIYVYHSTNERYNKVIK